MNIKYFPHQAKYEGALPSEILSSNKGKSTLTYDVEIKHVKSEGAMHFIEVSKKNMLINDNEVQDAFNDVLLITAEAINKIIFKINKQGILLDLVNFEEIKKKWFDVRKNIEKIYKGNEITRYLNEMQTQIIDPEVLWKTLSKSLFYTIFFNGIYKNYDNDRCFNQELILRDLLPTQAVGVLVDQVVLFNKEENTYQLSLKGKGYII